VSILWNIIRRKKENVRLLFYVGILISTFLLLNLVKYKCCPAITSASSPLLLEYCNSTKEAEVKVIMWFDDQDLHELFREEMPSDNWHWEKASCYTAEGKKINSLVGRTRVDKIKELELKKWYFELVGKIKDAGGKVYLDERICADIDIAAFLCKAGAEPQQWMLDDSTLSVAALKSDLGNNIYAGKDKINMQLLTRISNGSQQSVLALPALIDEF
jgi:hypothetical protein